MNRPKSDISIGSGDWESIPGMRRFSYEAMAAVFEVFMVHGDARYAEQAAWAAFGELDKIEAELSRFIESSEISQINNLAPGKTLRIGEAAFECLELSRRMYDQTGGAFDVTIGSLLGCWRDKDGTVRNPSKEELDLARSHTGMGLLKLDKAEQTVQLSRTVKLDLGGIGKGYAVDKMVELLLDWDIETVLVNGGYSTVLGVGELPGGGRGWPVTLSDPGESGEMLAEVSLRKRALSGSGLQKGKHIIDPRTGQGVEGKVASWSGASTAGEADALSTAFMVMTPEQIKRYCLRHLGTFAMLLVEEGDKKAARQRVLRYGI